MNRLNNSKASCLYARRSARIRHKKLQKLGALMRETLDNAQENLSRLPRSRAIPLRSVLLALGYESRLVEMLSERGVLPSWPHNRQTANSTKPKQ